MPYTIKIQSLAMPTARSLLITADLASPNTMSVDEEYVGARAYLHALQPFFDLAGRGTADELSIASAVATGLVVSLWLRHTRWWVVVMRCEC